MFFKNDQDLFTLVWINSINKSNCPYQLCINKISQRGSARQMLHVVEHHNPISEHNASGGPTLHYLWVPSPLMLEYKIARVNLLYNRTSLSSDYLSRSSSYCITTFYFPFKVIQLNKVCCQQVKYCHGRIKTATQIPIIPQCS